MMQTSRRIPLIWATVSFLFYLLSPQGASARMLRSEEASTRFDQQADQALAHLLQNLQNKDKSPGAVIASPSLALPDYFYHWVRDAALVMNSLLQVYERTTDADLRRAYRKQLLNWVAFEERLHKEGTLGEPKFYVNGKAFTGPWGRPQNDGPAARAITLIHLAHILLEEGEGDFVREKLYTPELPARSLVKMNLEYTAHHWQESSFDLWEEVRGHHFYTRMLQRSALVQGADLAERMGDPGAARFYRQEAARLDDVLLTHRDFAKGLIEPTVGNDGGWAHKQESLDVAVLLGSLHASLPGATFSVNDEWILASAQKLEERFQDLYAVNRNSSLATAIGRYPEDVYDGHGFSGGNPWFLATNAYAELYCRAADELLEGRSAGQASEVERSQNLRESGIAYLDRVLYHMGKDGHMSEQFSRKNGFMQGAVDLSWSYASYLTAYMACFKSRAPGS